MGVLAGWGSIVNAGYMLSIGRIYGPGGVRVAAKHNLREIAAEVGADSHIDVERIGDNFILRGRDVAADVALDAKTLMEKAGVTKVRKNAVMALELLFMLPSHTSIDQREYFERATRWAEAYFAVPVLSSIVHLDESAPHCHVLLLPLVNGKMNGSDLHGGKAKLWAMQKSFHQEVSAKYGFIRQEPRKRASVTSRAAAMKQLQNYFQATSKMSPTAIQALLVPHAQDPHTLLRAFGIDEQPLRRAPKSFVEIMTAPCKPERRNTSQPTATCAARKINAEERRDSIPYTCVGKGSPRKVVSPIHYAVFPSQQTALTANSVEQAGERADEYRGTTSLRNGLSDASASLDEEAGLAELYAPLKARIAQASASLIKLTFIVQCYVDLIAWCERGKSLLNLRFSRAFEGKGSLRAWAELMLADAWRRGDAAQAGEALQSFVNDYSSELRAHRPDHMVPKEWAQRVPEWLFSTDHIAVGYQLEFDGGPIEHLSLGTRGIVLLLLYLAVDLQDDRPLIIDRLEENFDPQSIYDELVVEFQLAKLRRQVIIVTHNANLVVNTDADQVIVTHCDNHEPGCLHELRIRRAGRASDPRSGLRHPGRWQACVPGACQATACFGLTRSRGTHGSCQITTC